MKSGLYSNEQKEIKELLISHGYYDAAFITQAVPFMVTAVQRRFLEEHSIRVALMTARMGLPATAVAAALLHELDIDRVDIPWSEEDPFFREVVQIHGAYRKLTQALRDREIQNAELGSDTERLALYIKCADRVDILRYYNRRKSNRSEEELLRTSSHLLSLVEHEHPGYITQELENRMMRLSTESIYRSLVTQKERIRMENREAVREMRRAFEQIGAAQTSDCIIHRHAIFCDVQECSAIQFVRACSLTRPEKSIADLKVSKYTTPLFDVYIVFSDLVEYNTMMDDFLDFFRKHLRAMGAYLKGIRWESGGRDDSYIIICDRSMCQYRVFLREASTHRRKVYGTLVDGLLQAQEARRDRENSMVYVYDKSRRKRMFPKGSTLLDFAFQIHREVAFTAVYAMRNGEREDILSNRPLQTGDSIEIITSQESGQCVTLEYFEHVTSRYAVKELVGYFKRQRNS